MTTPSIPNLGSIIAAGSQAGLQPDTQAAGQGQQVPVVAPQVNAGSVVPVQQPANPVVQQPPAQSVNLRGVLVQSGYTIPDDMTDDDIASSVVANLNSYYEIQGSPEYTEYQKQRAEFQKYMQSQQQKPPAAQAQPAQTPTPQTQQQPAISSEQLLHAVTAGAVTRGQDGKWVATNPAYAAYAQAMQASEEKAAQSRVSMAANPEEFIQKTLADALEKQRLQFEESQKPLLEKLESFRIQQERQVVDQWVQQNSTKLFSNDGQLTPYGKLYQKLEADIESQNPNIGIAERHQRVLQYVSLLDSQSAQQPAQQPVVQAPQQSQQPQVPQQSFMQKVGQNRMNGVNRLSEYEGPAQNSVTPRIPVGKGGFPSLEGIIAQQHQN